VGGEKEVREMGRLWGKGCNFKQNDPGRSPEKVTFQQSLKARREISTQPSGRRYAKERGEQVQRP
jgi:hypothetical protein